MTAATPPMIEPTTIPCPSWCAYGLRRPGHGYEGEGYDGQQLRYHSTADVCLPVEGIKTSLGQYGEVEIIVDVSSEEALVISSVGVSLEVSQPAVTLEVSGRGGDIAWMTADEALALADMLARAADQLRN